MKVPLPLLFFFSIVTSFKNIFYVPHFYHFQSQPDSLFSFRYPFFVLVIRLQHFLLTSINFKLTNLCWMQMLALENQYHNELQLELQGVQYSSSVSNMNKQSSVEDAEAWEESLPNMQQIAEDTTTMSKVVMSRKKRRLYEAMQVTLLTPIMLLLFLFDMHAACKIFFLQLSIKDYLRLFIINRFPHIVLFLRLESRLYLSWYTQ